jgi:hypothetical protein
VIRLSEPVLSGAMTALGGMVGVLLSLWYMYELVDPKSVLQIGGGAGCAVFAVRWLMARIIA